jgi:pimeloyl-ACP methyl ester carboxylesterase
MPKKTAKDPAEYILPLYMNGLQGRMMRVHSPSRRRREILLIYGHHAVLERWWSLVQNLTPYGNVTMPDLPGFGGMESFYKIGAEPTIDNFADYLAAFVKLRYKNKRLTIVGISFGFLVVTRMLQRYPELAKKVDLLTSIVGFMHKDDLVFNKRTRRLYKVIARVLATRPVALIIRYGFLNRFTLKHFYIRLPNSRRRMIEITPEEFEKSMDFEVVLWQANDVRTHWLTTSDFLVVDNTKTAINLPIVHVVSEQDHYLKNIVVEQHMRQVFTDYTQFVSKGKAHVPSVLADKKAMSILVPPGLRKILRQKPSQIK